MRRKIKTGSFLLSVCLAGLLSANTYFCYNTFYKPAQLLSKAIKEKPLDVIIVPTDPFQSLKIEPTFLKKFD